MKTLFLYNSLTHEKEAFVPLEPGKIKLYVCGVTVYDYCHLGHARFLVCFDVIVRFMRELGYDVHYVRNITDIDDKIIQRAAERGITVDALTETFIHAMDEDARALHILPPNQSPRATHYIKPMIELIQRLMDSGHAYLAANGDVCFEVSQFEPYGKLSRKKMDDLLSGARIEIVEAKRSPLDFVLWKKSKPEEPAWDAPWGKGRPGWHIECSAMAIGELGEHFDIHGGGLDLQFPHHENEIAQSEAATQKPFANYWLHVGMLQVDNAKMAKSVGNFFTIQDVLKQHHPEVIRYFLLSSHYRSPLNYSADNLMQAASALTRLYQSIKNITLTQTTLDPSWEAAFHTALCDDFNTPEALAVLFQLSHELNRNPTPALAYTLKYLCNLLGLMNESPDAFLQQGAGEIDTQWIESQITARNDARAARDFTKADNIRKALLVKGIVLEDNAAGTTWRRNR